MAKIRVYELARDLNMKNKALLDKLIEMKISVRSHMSSLEDETVAQIKAYVLGRKASLIEEKRVQPTVIRRRKRVEPKEPPAEPETSREPGLPEVQGPEAAADHGPSPESAPESAAAAEVQKPQAPAPAPDAPRAPAAKKSKPVEAARVIRRPAPSQPPAPAAADGPGAPEPAQDETVQAAGLDLPSRPAEETPAAPESAAPEDVSATEPAVHPVEERPAQEPETAAKKGKKNKKGKKSLPAKIISLPEARAAAAVPAREKATAAPVVAPRSEGIPAGPEAQAEEADGSAKDRKRKKKKVVAEPEVDRKFFKKKISFRRKEVVEGAALYADTPRSRKQRKAAKAKALQTQKTQITVPKAIKRRVKIDDAIMLSDLAKRMGIKASDMIRTLMGMGVMATVNQTIDFETAALVASEFEYEVERAAFEEQTFFKQESDAPEQLVVRPPVVTIMGHVDHGKTSLLDVIRKTRITEGEAGGITQHIGAYHVSTDRGQIVFLDTPGHEAFTAMRSRGAKVTDLVVLVVAADDGVMPQTLEAINHSKASEVPIIVAVNKIDKANADPDRVIRQLADVDLIPEDWGGSTIFVRVSAKQNTGIDELLEMILLQSEVLELKANPNKLASGHVVEAKLDAGRGPVATVLVQEGTLHTGDPVVCGIHYGKVRALLDDRGQTVKDAGPSIPVEIIGLSGVPQAGDEFAALADEKSAKQVSLHRIQKQRSVDLAKTSRLSLEGLFEKMKEGEIKDLNLILKADVHGSIEALRDSLIKLSNDEVNINVIHSATGAIIESDVSLATVSNAIIIGFNVRPNTKVQEMAAEENVDIRYYNVIYNVIKDVKDAIVGMMASSFVEHVLGRAVVREIFHVPRIGTIAGSYVTDGKVERNQKVRLLREGVVLYEGRIGSLRRFKDDVKEVQSGYECGIGVENYNDIKIEDEIECFVMEEIKPELK